MKVDNSRMMNKSAVGFRLEKKSDSHIEKKRYSTKKRGGGGH